MFLEVSNLTEEEIAEKLNYLYTRYKSMAGRGDVNLMEQMQSYIIQLEMALQDRALLDEGNKWESGSVAIIGEPEKKKDTVDGQKENRNTLRFKGRTQ